MVLRPIAKLILSVVTVALLLGGFGASADTFNPQINYQGKLTDANNIAVADGSYTIDFNLYTAPSGGSPIWTENWDGTGGHAQVTVTSGVFSVMLGTYQSLSSLDFNRTLYLGVTVGTDAEMTPRKLLGAVPAAFEAAKLQGQTWEIPGTIGSTTPNTGAFTTLSSTYSGSSTALTVNQSGAGFLMDVQKSGASKFTIDNNGNVGIGTTNPDVNLQVGDDTGQRTIKIAAGNAAMGNNSPVLDLFSDNDKEAVIAIAGDNLVFANTDGIADYNSATLLAAANMIINTSGKVGIGTTAPSGMLTVAGASGDTRSVTIDDHEIKFRGDGVAHMSIFGPDTGKPYVTIQNTSSESTPGTAGTDLFTVLSGGNVGIGTTNPGQKLEVYGSALINTGNLSFSSTNGILANDVANLNDTAADTQTLIVPFSGSFQASNGRVDQANYFSGLEFRHNIYDDYRSQLATATSGSLPVLDVRNKTNGVWGDWFSAVLADVSGNVGIGNANPGVLLDLGSAGKNGILRFNGSTSGGVTFQAAAVAGSGTYIWPTALPNSNKVLQSDSSGVLSWVTSGTGSSQWDSISGGINYAGGNVGIGTTASLRKLDILDAGNPQLRLTYTSGSAYGDLQIDSSGNLTILPSGGNTTLGSGTEVLTVLATGSVGIGNTNPGVLLDLGSAGTNGALRFNGSTSGNVTFQAAAAAGSGVYTLPTALPNSNKVLQSDSSGALSWVAGGSLSQWTAAGNNIYYNAGNVGIGTTNPTAVLQLKAGTAAAGTAPLKFTSGTLLGTTEGGTLEFDGNHLYFTASDGGSRYQLDGQAGGAVFSSLTAAVSPNTIDNTNYAQTWNWSTASTQNPLTINANALTTGTALTLAHSNGSNIASGGSLLRLSSSGIDTGITNGVLLDLSSAASTGGTQFLQTYTSLTSGIGQSIVTNALTTGQAFSIPHSGSVIADTGSLARISSSTNDTGGATNGVLLDLSSTASASGTQFMQTYSGLTTGVGMKVAHTTSVIADTGSLVRITSNTNDTGGATNGVLLDLSNTASTGGTQFVQTYPALTTGVGQSIVANALTTGEALIVSHGSGSNIADTGSLVRISSAGIDTGGATNGVLLDLFNSGSTAGTQVLQTYPALTTGIGEKIVTNALTTGTAFIIPHTGTTPIADTGSLIRISSTTNDTGGATNGVLLDLSSSASTGGTQFLQTYSGLTTGIGQSIVASALTTGQALNISHTGSVIASGGSLLRLASAGADTGITNGILLDLSSTGSASGTQFMQTYSGLTTGIGDTIVTNALTTGQALSIAHGSGSVIASGGSLLRLASAGADTGITNGLLLDLSSTGSTAGTQFMQTYPVLATGIGQSIVANALTTGQALNISHSSGSNIADTGSLVRISSAGIDTGGATNGVLLDLSSTGSTGGTQFLQTYSGLTTGVGMKVTHTTSIIADTGSLVRITSNTNDTGGATNGVLLDLNSTASTAGTQFMQTYPVLATGIGQSIVANALTTGQALNISHSSGSNIADTGSLVRISSAGIDTGGATNGVLLDLSSTGSAAGTQFLQTYSALTTGIGQSIVANALGSGSMLNLASQAANGNFTGTFLNANLSGNNAGNTGTLIKVTVSGASSAAVPLMVTNLGTGLSLRVNDETGDTDTTPFVIDASGNVGIGNAAPGALLDLGLAGTKAGVMRLEGATAGYVAIQTTANVTAPWTMTLPATAGTAGQILQTDGSGTMTWTANNATGMTNPMTHAGDIIYASADGNPATPTALAKGNNGQCLLLSGGVPTWGSCGGASDTALSAITAATTSPSAIDSLNNVLTWNWSTLNTGTALTENFNGLTSGTAYNIASSSTGITTAGSNIGSLLNVATSGAITNFSGNLVNISMAGATNTNNTGALLNIVDQGATNEQTQLLAMRSFSTNEANTLMSLTSASTGAVSNGLARFNFGGAHTGNGFQIDDATVTGRAMQINVNSLTAGQGLAIYSSSVGLTQAGPGVASLLGVTAGGANTGFIGSLVHFGLSDTTGNAGNTGNVLNIWDNGVANQTKLLTLNSSSTADTASLMSLTSATTGAISNGIVRFNFNAAHTNNGFQIDDATATGNAMQINANSLSTGKALAIVDTGAGLTVNGSNPYYGSLFDVQATGAPTSFTGYLASVQMTNTSGSSMNTGSLLNIYDAGAANRTTLLNIKSASTDERNPTMSLTSANAGYVSNGIARFNFTGAHTGNGLQIDDAATQTGTAMAIGVNGLTTGRILSIIDSGTALTAATGSAGSLLNVNSTGYITGFTGNLASIQMSNASNAGNTGSLLYIADSGGVNLTKLLTMSSSSTTNTNALMSLTSATTAAISNGIVRFNFNAAHTANGFEIDDLTQTGKVMQVNASALTTGNAVNITANTLTTGQALLVSHTTSSVIADTGSLVRITSTMNDTGGATNGVLLDLSSTSSTAGTQFLQKYSALTTGIGQKIQTDVLTTGTALFITRAVGTAIASGGSLERISSAAIDTGSTNGVLLDLNSTASTAGTQFMQTYSALTTGIGQSIATNALTTGQAFVISHTGGIMTSGGSLARISSATADSGSTNGVLLDLASTGSLSGTQFLQTYSALTTGIGQSIVANALTTGKALYISHSAGSAILDTGSLLKVSSAGVDTGGATNGVLLDLSNTGSTAGTQFLQTYPALTSGIGQSIVANALLTGTAFIIPHTTSVIASGGSLARISSTSNDTGTGNGVLLDLSSANSTAGTQFLQTYGALTTGIGQSIVANSLTNGYGLSIASSSTNINTGALAYFSSTGAITNSGGSVLNVTSTGVNTAGYLATFIGNNVTSGGIMNINANGLSSGNAVNIASTSTAAASNTQTLLNIALSGANGTSSQTTYGAQISNIHTGTSAVDVGLLVSANGAAATNYGLLVTNGNVGIGNTAPGALLDLGLAGTKAGVMRLEGATAGYVGLQAIANVTSPWTMTLPATPGTNGQILQTDGSGTMTWTANNATGMTNPMTAAGDIIYASAGGSPATPAALPKGSNGQCLLLSGGLPAWGSCGGASATALSAITAATTSPAAIDSGSNALIWNWGSLSTQTAMTQNFNGLTSGTAFKITTSSSNISTAGANVGSLLDITTTAAIPSSFTGNLVNISENGTGGTTNTSNLLNINDASTNDSAKLLTMNSSSAQNTASIMSLTSATTGNASNGIARFNFTGAHTGNGFQIDDATVTGTAMKINVNSLGNGIGGLSIVDTGTALTGNGAGPYYGSLLNIHTSGAITTFNGRLASIQMLDAVGNSNNTGILLNINDAGAANKTQLLTMSSSSTTATNALMSLTSASAGAAATGLAYFNFTGAHTGNGFQLVDATQGGTAMQINANSLTTGKALAIADTGTALSNALSNTGSLLDLNTSGAITGFTGNLASIQMSGASAAGNTGSLLYINDAGAANMTKILTMNSSSTTNTSALMSLTSASAGSAAFGLARFNFTGANTGNGLQLDDATLTGSAMQINVNSLTSGKGLSVTDTGLGLTAAGSSLGSLLNVNTSGNTTGFTGSLVNISMAGMLTSGPTGSLLNIADTSTGTMTKLLTMNSSSTSNTTSIMSLTSASAGAVANGLARFNFTGAARTGNAIQIDDVTQTGNVMTINSTALTTGYAENINVAGAAVLQTGGGLKITGPTSTAIMTNTTGLLNVTTTGNIANTKTGEVSGTLFQLNGNGIVAAALASISDTTAMTGNGRLLDLTANAATTASGLLTMNATGLTTGYAQSINVTGTAITSGGGLKINGPSGGATMNNTTGLLNVTTSSAITNSLTGAASGTLFQLNGNGILTATLGSISDTSMITTTGKLLDLTANSATTPTGLLTMNAQGLTTGYAQQINVNGSNVLTTGGALQIVGPTGAAVMTGGTGLLNISSTGALANATTGVGSGSLLQVSGTGNITSTLASISENGTVMTTTGKLLDLTANGATTVTGLLTMNATGLTTGYDANFTNGATLSTGGAFNLTGGSYLHTGAETGSLLNIAVTDASSNAAGAAVTNGIYLNPIFNTTASAGPKTLSGINVTPTLTACGTTGGTCTLNDLVLAAPALTQSTTNTMNIYGLNLSTAGALVQQTAAGTINWYGANIQMPSITQTSGTVKSVGLNITGGTVTSGTSYALTTDVNAGNVGIGTLTPGSLLTVAQPNTTVAGAAGTTLSAQANNAFTLTDSTQTTITALNGLQLNLGVPTINQNGGAVTVTTASTLYVATPAAGTSVTITNNRPIDTAAGAYLTSGGVWTSNASWARLKENINPVSVSNIYDWMRTDYQPVTYRYKADSPGTYDEVGFIWDQILSTGPVGQEFFNLVSADAQGSVSTKSSEGMLFALTHEAATRIYDLSGKVDGLSLELNEAGLINSTSTATSTADFVENHPGFVETIRQILAKLGVSIQNGIASIQSVVTQNLKIGSAQNPSGFTIYDQVTKQPYCVGIANGEFIKTAGDCASAVPGTSATSTVPTVQAAPVPAPVVAPVLPPSMISLTELPVASVAPVSGSDGGTTTAAAASAPVTTTATTTTTDTQPSTDLTAASRSSAAPATIATPTQTVTPATTDSALAPTAPATPAVSAATPDSTTTSAATTQPATDSSATN